MTAKNKKKTTKTKDFIKSNKIHVVYKDDVKVNKQNVAVSCVLLARLTGKPLAGIKKGFCANTAQYRNGKKAATADAKNNGNYIYIQNAAKGLDSPDTSNGKWVSNALSKIAAGRAGLDIAIAYNVIATSHKDVKKQAVVVGCNKAADKAAKDDGTLATAYRQIAATIKTAK